jgi:hypothetical protein
MSDTTSQSHITSMIVTTNLDKISHITSTHVYVLAACQTSHA